MNLKLKSLLFVVGISALAAAYAAEEEINANAEIATRAYTIESSHDSITLPPTVAGTAYQNSTVFTAGECVDGSGLFLTVDGQGNGNVEVSMSGGTCLLHEPAGLPSSAAMTANCSSSPEHKKVPFEVWLERMPVSIYGPLDPEELNPISTYAGGNPALVLNSSGTATPIEFSVNDDQVTDPSYTQASAGVLTYMTCMKFTAVQPFMSKPAGSYGSAFTVTVTETP